MLQGVEFSILPIDFEWALQQCSATALPVITWCLYGPWAVVDLSVYRPDVVEGNRSWL